jgi:hypothetical protein
MLGRSTWSWVQPWTADTTSSARRSRQKTLYWSALVTDQSRRHTTVGQDTGLVVGPTTARPTWIRSQTYRLSLQSAEDNKPKQDRLSPCEPLAHCKCRDQTQDSISRTGNTDHVGDYQWQSEWRHHRRAKGIGRGSRSTWRHNSGRSPSATARVQTAATADAITSRGVRYQSAVTCLSLGGQRSRGSLNSRDGSTR